MAFAIMVAVICVYGLLAERQCKALTEAGAGSKEAVLRKFPKDCKRRIYVALGTLLNLGLMYLSFFYYQDRMIYALKLAMVLEWLLIVAFVDFYTGLIPNSLILQGLLGALAYMALEIIAASYPAVISLKDYFFGLLLGGGVFALSAVISRGSIGMGDIKLFAVLGLMLGISVVFGLLFFTIFISALAGLLVLLLKKGDKRTMMPLGPFTCAGMTVVLMMGM